MLLVGGGGREHAIARSLGNSPARAIRLSRQPVRTSPSPTASRPRYDQPDSRDDLAREVDATLAVIGREAALAAGVADALDDAGIYTFGPQEQWPASRRTRRSSGEFMREHDIPGCPDFETFEDMDAACEYIDEYDGDLAVKPAGLTGGKGVRVIGDQCTAEEAKEYLRSPTTTASSSKNASSARSSPCRRSWRTGTARTPAVQDHKRAYEGDEGRTRAAWEVTATQPPNCRS